MTDPAADGGSRELLRIDRVYIDRFGGWSERSLDLPENRLIVIHGPNEAGKSTLAEFITWLLVGPSGTAADAQRFGRPDDRIGGQMWLRLGDVAVTASGTFRVLKQGAPNENDLVIDLGGALTADEWRVRLGGIDPQVFTAIYRLWGEELHEGAEVEDELSRVALGALAGRTNVPSLLKQLDKEIANRTSRRAQNAESVLTISAQIEQNRSDTVSASDNAQKHSDIEALRRRLEAERAELASGLGELRAEARVVARAIELSDQLIELRAAQAELDQLDVVPEQWAEVAADPEAVADVVREVTETAERLETATAEMNVAIETAGLDESAVADLAIGDAEMVEISAGATELGSRQADLGEVDTALVEARRAAAEAGDLLDHAMARRPGLRAEDLAVMRLESAERSSLTTSIATWTSRVASADSSRAEAVSTADRVSAIESELEAARAAWTAFDTGQDAEAWWAAGQSGPSDPARRWWWASPALGAAVAVAAVLLGQWTIAALAGLAAVLIAAISLTGRSDQPRSEAQHAEMTQLATRIIALVRQRDDEQAGAVRAAAAHRRDLEALDESRLFTLQTAAAFSVPIDAETPEVATSQFEASERIIEAHRAVIECRRRVDGLEQRRKAVLESLEAAQQRLSTALAAAGLISEVATSAIDDAIPAYRRAQSAWRAFSEARTAHQDASQRYQDVIASLPVEVSQWRPSRLVEYAHELAELQSSRRRLEESIESVSGQLAVHRAGDQRLAALLERSLSEAELTARATEIDESIDALSRDVDQMSERIGELSNQLDALSRVDQLASLAIERGSLQERSEELAVEALVAAIARRIVGSVADAYEREHQPALVSATERMVRRVAPDWNAVLVRADDAGRTDILVEQRGLPPVRAEQLSTGARSLLYLALRIAMAEHDSERRSISVPLICDDPLVHLDDDRAAAAFDLLRHAAESGRQVVVFTCHERTVRTATSAGAAIVPI